MAGEKIINVSKSVDFYNSQHAAHGTHEHDQCDEPLSDSIRWNNDRR